MGRILKHVPRLLPQAPWNAARLLAARAARHGDALGIAYRDRRYTWREVDAWVNRYANAFREHGVGRGDTVALMMDNRPEFLFALTGLNRLGASSALINTNIAGRGLAHAINIAGAKRILTGTEHAAQIDEILPELQGVERSDVFSQRDTDGPESDFASFDAAVAAASEQAPPTATPRGDEHMCYIYTSGTTGLPKAAIIKNSRWHAAGVLFGAAVLELAPGEVNYVALPLYHSSAMFAGWGAALTSGAAIALRRKFSASNFWRDVRAFDATSFVYIGELCRYLLNQPPSDDDRRHRVRVATGNGLRPDIWQPFQQRFGVPLIREFYGATEGNAPLINFTGRPGMVGRLRSGQVLVRCDLETGELRRNAAGRCEAVGVGESGLLLAKITRVAAYDGYADPEATRKKIVEGAFAPGDRYFNSGDLLTLHADNWLSFSDRVGDTFRWKGENVSTNEVAEVLNAAPGVLESNVYGVAVPGAEGRAGMASLNCGSDFSIDELATFVTAKLPLYQRPYFVRLQTDMRITGTFKHQKVDYRSEGFDPSRVADPLYFLDGDRYVPLDAALYGSIQSGEITLR
jgi:acyl-CoA synthetase (AMP-forming)/AMP-acid ligase II